MEDWVSPEQRRRESKISDLQNALLKVIEEQASGMSEEDTVAAIIDVAQQKASCIRDNPYADGIEVMLRSFSAVFKLDLFPDLANSYIGEKFRVGFIDFAWAVKEHMPDKINTFNEVIHRFFGTEKNK